MSLTIRQEAIGDRKIVYKLIQESFVDVEISDHLEQDLVERLRKSESFIPELSLVAEESGELVGYILLTKIQIKNDNESHPSLALAPVVVRPDQQNKGIGAALIKEAHSKAKKLGYDSVILLGHKDYYPRFGYKKCRDFGIKMPFEVAEEYCMAKELKEGALKDCQGTVEYDSAFFE